MPNQHTKTKSKKRMIKRKKNIVYVGLKICIANILLRLRVINRDYSKNVNGSETTKK